MEIELDDRWSIGGKPHGGYLLREIVSPLLTQEHPDPFAVSAHFLRSPDAGPAEVVVETLRSGRRVTQSRASLVQGGVLCVEALVTTGRLDPDADAFWSDAEPPRLPPVEDLVRAPHEPFPGFRIGHLEHVDVRGPSLAGSVDDSTGAVSAYLRVADGPTTTLDLLVLADALPPVPLDMGLAGWVPTVELTVLVRGVPAEGWLTGTQRTRLMQDGWLDEDCDLWDSRGRLVCQARQLAGFRPA